MSYIQADNPNEQEMFDFLEDLRQSGDTNMFGAGKYLEEAFDLGRAEARSILSQWMKAHDDPSRVMEKPKTATKTTVRFETVAHTETEDRA